MSTFKFADDLYNLIAALHRNDVISYHDALRYNRDIFKLVEKQESFARKEIYKDKNISIYARH